MRVGMITCTSITSFNCDDEIVECEWLHDVCEPARDVTIFFHENKVHMHTILFLYLSRIFKLYLLSLREDILLGERMIRNWWVRVYSSV